MAMIDLDDDREIEEVKEKDVRNKKHIWCSKCGRPKECNDPNCTHVHHCTCGKL